jgi:hypothetical protein
MVFGNRLSIGIEVHAGGARIAVLTLKPSPTVLRCVDVVVPPGDEGRALTLMEKALTQAGVPGANVHLAFSPASGAMRHLLFGAPKLKKPELMQVAFRELKKDNTLDAATAFLALESLGSDEGESVQRHMLVALHREPVEEAATLLAANKHVVRSATTTPMALLRAAGVASLPGDGVVALALMDPRRSSLLVLDRGVPRFFRDIPTSVASSRESDDTVIAQALARELDISLVYFAQQFRPKQVDTVMVVGDPAVAERVIEWMEEVPRYRIVRFGPSPGLAIEPQVQENLAAFAVAVGAALGPKVKGAPDLLPTELRGRPERAYVLMGAGALATIFLAATMSVRAGKADRLSVESGRADLARSRYEELKRQVEAASVVDQRFGQALRWNALFEDMEAYHARGTRIWRSLPELMPPRAKVVGLATSDLGKRPVPPGAQPPPPGEAPNVRFHVEGVVRANDLGTAQADLSTFIQRLESIPGATGVEPAPLKSQNEGHGWVEQPYIVDVPVKNRFPLGGTR